MMLQNPKYFIGIDTRTEYMRMLWTLNLYSLNKTTSIASAQSNCNIVGVEHRDGYYFSNNTLLTILILRRFLFTKEGWFSIQDWV